MVYGNTSGIKAIVLDELESLHGMYDKNFFIDREVLEVICRHTSALNREICVFISRGGELLGVGIGDSTTVPLKDISIKRDPRRLNGIRCVHTHPSSSSRLSDVDISALKKSRYDCMVAVGVTNGKPIDMDAAYISGQNIEEFTFSADNINDDYLIKKIRESEQESMLEATHKIEGDRALLINVSDDRNYEISLLELKRLAETADIAVLGSEHQSKKVPDREFYIGTGKLRDIKLLCQVINANLVIFDNALTSLQFFKLEEALGIPVMDRSALILDIFAKHAVTNEGKLQVELARMKYNLPKLLGKGTALSRQGGASGGVKSKGEGEQKLEIDRRNIREKIQRLSERIDKIHDERELRRSQRSASGIKTVAIVGYTNAGKSSLMNKLSNANVAVEDKLFKTLDSVTRHMRTLGGKEYLLTDTVGFISRLPHEFVDAFKSTLEEVKIADLLLHVVDCSSADMIRQYDTVLEVLKSLGAHAPVLTVYNKCDLAREGETMLPVYKDSVHVSALTGQGLPELKEAIEQKLFF